MSVIPHNFFVEARLYVRDTAECIADRIDRIDDAEIRIHIFHGKRYQ